ncbi:histidine phosphatase family protein [Microbulbifer halophilus]|uniref:Histidine phosphatase family protein n=1 Tax=Microbulbifer halophilus TaxID=453963 RepID=A0ABW5EH71_9GAMM|nr:histidine phosphatase family protein [Microbulbifer halophilus]MCW8127793.1 histidine phosphatase family protein [Microbulbifer halophilus]
MTKILLVRHGEAAKSPRDADPGLTELGQRQARELAERYARSERFSLVSSPKARAQQTAQPLADRWQAPVSIEEAVIEIPSPPDVPLHRRGDWLRGLLESEWDKKDALQSGWRRNTIDYLAQLQQDTAVFCHFMVLNSVVAHIRGDRRVRQFRPDYTSVTELSLDGGKLEIRRLGAERRSRIV